MILKTLRYLRNAVRNRLRHRQTIADFKRLYRRYLAEPRRFTDQSAQILLRQAFVASKGETLEWAWQLQKEKTSATVKPFQSALFPKMDLPAVNQAADALRVDGFYILPWRMSDAWVDAVTNKAKNLNVTGVAGEDDVQKPETIRPKQATYWHKAADLAGISELREFVNDPGLHAIATNYLECTPIVDLLASWWTYPTDGRADSKAAQLYHFDLDRIRWLKIFVYLTDVTATSGPHAYIRGSHKTIGEKVSHDGRYSDADVFSMYDRKDEQVFVAPRGTIIIEDTLGFHKGIPATAGHRFIFEFELSINHFGYPYEDPGVE